MQISDLPWSETGNVDRESADWRWVSIFRRRSGYDISSSEIFHISSRQPFVIPLWRQSLIFSNNRWLPWTDAAWTAESDLIWRTMPLKPVHRGSSLSENFGRSRYVQIQITGAHPTTSCCLSDRIAYLNKEEADFRFIQSDEDSTLNQAQRIKIWAEYAEFENGRGIT
jgi:hypothetical protein